MLCALIHSVGRAASPAMGSHRQPKRNTSEIFDSDSFSGSIRCSWFFSGRLKLRHGLQFLRSWTLP